MFEKGGDVYVSRSSQFGKKIIGGRIKKVTKKTIVVDFDTNTKTIRKKDFGIIFGGMTYGSFCQYSLTIDDADRASILCSDKSAGYFQNKMEDAKKNMHLAIEARNSAPTIRPLKE